MNQYALDVEFPPGNLRRVPVDRSPWTVGRDTTCDLVISDTAVSRVHATLKVLPEGLAIVDEGSRNGVLVNDEKVAGTRHLRAGDAIRIGPATLCLREASRFELSDLARPSETVFFPARATWDAKSHLGVGPRAVAQTPPPPDWTHSLPFLLEAAPEKTHERLRDAIEAVCPFERCFIILLEIAPEGKTTIVAQRIHPGTRPQETILSTAILKRVVQAREAVIVTAKDSSPGSSSFFESGASTALCVPVIVGGKVMGVIYLDHSSAAAGIGREQIELLGPLAGIAALKLENLRLLNDQIATQLLMRDLGWARTVQQNLFPRTAVTVPGYAVDGFSSPCYHVGGDYFDYLLQQDGQVNLVIGDVSGKGLAAALYMADVRATLHAHLRDARPLEELMALMARHLEETFRPEDFLTLLLARLDPRSHLLTYCNAGHLPALVFRTAEAPLELEVTDPALNLFPCSRFHLAEHRLEPAEVVCFYTDGIIEAESPAGEQFGGERLRACLSGVEHHDLPAMRKTLLAQVEAFAGPKGPADDQTLLLLRRAGA